MTQSISAQCELVSFKLFFHGGLNQVQVHCLKGEGTCLSQYELAGSEHKLVLLQWLDNTTLLAMDSWGKLYRWPFHEGDHRTVEPVLDMQLRPFIDAWFIGNTLWFAAESELDGPSGQRLFGLDLAKLQLIYDRPMDLDFEEGTLVLLSQGEWACYQRSSKPGYKFRTHSVVRFNANTMEVQTTELASKPTIDPLSFRKTLFVDRQAGTLLCADTSSVEAITDDKGVSRYGFALQLVDLYSQRLLWSKTVRYLSGDEIADDFDRDEIIESLDAIANGDVSHQHNEAWQSLVECLTDVQFDSAGEHFWLAWQGGLVQCLTRQGEIIHGPTALHAKPGQSFSQHEESYLLECINQGDQTQLLLAQGDREWAKLWWANVPKACEAGVRTEDSAALIATQAIPAQRAQLRVPRNEVVEPMKSGQINFFCADLQCRQHGVATLNSLLNSLPALQANYERQAKATHDTILPLFFCFTALQPQLVETASEYNLFPSLAYELMAPTCLRPLSIRLRLGPVVGDCSVKRTSLC
ncbi:hypothetical protein [Vibrio mexicanus]|uniref:hypothetical protein n=1 Tax=Vibrio mexicanus TaxID=1004326 RepID=UPI00063CB104|nr:hypothetical protein [Vibrio mexicanus]